MTDQQSMIPPIEPNPDHRDDDAQSIQEEPLDAANQSLADALRASFSILKAILLVLVVLYLFSNVRKLESHEQALVLRLGRLLPEVHEAGLMWKFPFPIDEIKVLPTRKSNVMDVDNHTFHRRPEEVGKALSFLGRSLNEGLNPTLDGALLTADSGLVHLRWKITYKFDDQGGVGKYLSGIAGDQLESAEDLLRTLVETTGIHIASEMTAEEVIRTRVDDVQLEMKRQLNERLRSLDSGLQVTLVEVYEPTPPLQIRKFFDDTQRAENEKTKRIRSAQQQVTNILSEAAGASHERVISVLDKIAFGGTPEEPLEAFKMGLDRLLMEEVEGKAGELIKNATSYHSVVVGDIQNDVNEYLALLPEYKRNPDMLIARLWERVRQEIFDRNGVTKIMKPSGLLEFRVKIPLDPEEMREAEKKRLEEKEFDVKKLRPTHYVPLGPEQG